MSAQTAKRSHVELPPSLPPEPVLGNSLTGVSSPPAAVDAGVEVEVAPDSGVDVDVGSTVELVSSVAVGVIPGATMSVVSVAALLAKLGSTAAGKKPLAVTTAVLVIVPVAAGSTVLTM